MNFARVGATALLSVAAVGVMAGTAHGEAGTVPTAVKWADRGVGYTMSWAPDHFNVTTTVESGRFEVTPDAVAVVGPDGVVVDRAPLIVEMAGRKIRFDPHVDAAGTSLTFNRPAAATETVSPLGPVALQDIYTGNNVVDDIVPDAVIGCTIGVMIGIIFFLVGAIPGCAIGAVLGGINGANRYPLSHR